MVRWLILSAAFLLASMATAQDTLEVRDAETGVSLPIASISYHAGNAYSNLDGKWAIPSGLDDTTRITIGYTAYPSRSYSLAHLRGQNFIAYLEPGTLLLHEVTVFGRRGDRTDRVTAAVEIISRKEIERAQSLKTTDALSDLTGAYVQESQFGGGSPILRGFEANRVLLVVDGVRLNNAIYRSGHLQNAITVDPLALDRIEVIYGAGSLAYGSDALGGVIHFQTREPVVGARPLGGKLGGEAVVNLGSAARSLQAGTRLEYGGKNWAGLTIASTTQTSDLRAGSKGPAAFPGFGRRNEFVTRIDGRDQLVENPRPLRQVGTEYNQYNLLQKLKFRLQNRLTLDVNLQATTSSNVPRYDNLIERRNGSLRWARWDYGPQTRTLAALRLRDLRPTKLYDQATYLISHQFMAEDRISRRFGDDLEENNMEGVHTSNLQIDYLKEFSRLTLRYGLDVRFDDVASRAFFRDVTGSRTDLPGLPTRYPSQGSQLFQTGVYADLDKAINDKWRVRGGLRLAYQNLSARFGEDDPIQWPARYLEGISNNNTAVTGSLGLRHNGRNTVIRFLVAQGFRAPNVDDFGKFREQNGFIQIPNPDLLPERSTTLEAGYEGFTSNGAFRAGIGIYHTFLRNAITRGPGALPGGENFLVSRGDTLRTQTNLNTTNAMITGIDVFAKWAITNAWEISADLHALRGSRGQTAPDGMELTLPQDHIPPAYGNFNIRYNRDQLSLGLRLQGQLAKRLEDYAVSQINQGRESGYVLDRTGTSDNLELTPIDPTTGTFAGSPAWWTLNLNASYEVSKTVSLSARVDNVLDRHYRSFASGISAAGIDLGLGLNWRF